MLMKRLLAYNGIDPGRFHARWISGSEAAKFRDTVAAVSEQIRALGPNTKYREPFAVPAKEGKS
jgi:coenzyme F420-reducing hydrogenase delta subunit